MSVGMVYRQVQAWCSNIPATPMSRWTDLTPCGANLPTHNVLLATRICRDWAWPNTPKIVSRTRVSCRSPCTGAWPCTLHLPDKAKWWKSCSMFRPYSIAVLQSDMPVLFHARLWDSIPYACLSITAFLSREVVTPGRWCPPSPNQIVNGE